MGTSTTQECRRQTTQAGAFLVWLAARDVALSACTQADLDAWHAEKYSTRRPAQAFLRWCMDSRRMPRLVIPNRPTANPHPMGQHQRVAALQRVLADASTPLRVRVAACLVLLFAQPVSRIVRMTVDDVLREGQHVALRLGDPPTPVPEPVADLLLNYLQALPASAPVIARALGYHDKSTTRIAADAGAPWKSYAPGDHSG
ncbi:hypothetical protein GCM10010266_73990 [Streptomyces griseomycini]|uniref:hypothetical protein n=2 Tax=Streptomyces griseomycini TaxID=66895 RepID=UPI0019C5B883|nr:hypothetical protein [Streptomyces griseomycini]GGQ40093.1 hypothetical protein GCM10010266_73990 [Streptomyces griseomycini]